MVEVQPERRAWCPGHVYGRKCECKAKGEKKMKYIQPEIPTSFRPTRYFSPPDSKMPNGTTYKLSYEPVDANVLKTCRGIPMITRENLISAGEFSGATTQKMSYGPCSAQKRDPFKIPSDHKLTPDGPMQNLTTHRHDFIPMPMEENEKYSLTTNLGFSKEPMENNSVASMSYRCPDYNTFKPAMSYKPHSRYAPPDSPIEGKSIQKLSYLAWKPRPKEEVTWGRAMPYVPSKTPFESSTVYKGSFAPPGRLVEDDEGHVKGCYCLYPRECSDSDNSSLKKEPTCPSTYNPNQGPPRPPPITDPHEC